MPLNSIILGLLFTLIRSSVVSIKTENEFQDLIKAGDALVKFYAPWCGHCKALAPKYEEVAKLLTSEKFDSVKVAEIDCTLDETKPICTKYEVRGYPTIKYFSPKTNEPIDYDGHRESKEMVTFIKRMAGESIIEIDSVEKLDRLVKEHDIVVVEYAEDAPSKKFAKVADDHKLKYTFALIKDKSIMDSHNMKFEEVAMFRNFDEPKVIYSAKGDINLPQWIHQHSFPIMGEMDSGNYRKYMERNVPILWLAVDKNSKQSQELISELSKSLKQHKDHVLAIYIDGVKFKEALISMGFEDKLPCAMIFENDTKYKFDGEYKSEALEKFVVDFQNKKLKVFLKSEKVPKVNKGPLYEVVGNTFESFVMDETYDVVLEFYVTYCQHCKEFEPEYKSLADRFASNQFIKIARINGQDNDTPINIEGYPTVLLFRSGKKNEPLKYSGVMKADDVERWITNNTRSAMKTQEKKEL